MKVRLLFLFVCLAWSGWAETFTPYSPDSLKKGDWLTIESVQYYPYVAPGIEKEIPWRAENIRRITILATVAEATGKTLSIDYTLDNLYDCRNDTEKQGFYYFDSRYQKDFALEDPLKSRLLMYVTHDRKSGNNTHNNKEKTGFYYSDSQSKKDVANEDALKGKQVMRVTYDRKSGNALTFDKATTSCSYAKTLIPFGIRQEGLCAYPGTVVQDSVNLNQLLIPVTKNILTGWKEDGNIQLAPNARIVDASFTLPPNTEFTCKFFNIETSGKTTVHKKLFIAYPTEYEAGKETTLLLTPGDSITQDLTAFDETHVTRYLGRGSEQNNLRYNAQRFVKFLGLDFSRPDKLKESFHLRDSLFQSTLKKDFENMDPYWRKVFEVSEQYIKGAFILDSYMKTTDKKTWNKSGLLDWQAPPFSSVNPLIDYAYSLKKRDAAHYSYFLYIYTAYKKQEIKADNLYLDKQKKLTPQEDYLLNKQLLSGYPKYLVSGINLIELMHEKTIHEVEDDYNDFITSCPDTSLTNHLTDIHNRLLPFEPGRNIQESGLIITDSLHLVKGSDRKYILLFLSATDGLSIPNLQNALDLRELLKTEGLASTVKLELYARFSPQNAERVKPYKAIPEEQKRSLNFKIGIGNVAILMREDGTILYRQLGGWEFDTKPILGLIQKDLNREDKSFNDFIKGFKEGILGALLLAAIIGSIYYFRTKTKQKQERNRRHIRELELRAIRSQMNPHFIFNALSSIQNLINRSANEEANKYLIDFSRLLRKVLATSEKKLVPLSDEIEQLELYLKLEQLRYPFSYSLTVDSNIEPDAIEIPGMLIQPFIENAVKHGIAPRGTGEITIRLSLQNQSLLIDITDDGPGLKTEANGGFGIRAVTNEFEILKTLYNTEIGITIENRQEKETVSGCHVRLSIPL